MGQDCHRWGELYRDIQSGHYEPGQARRATGYKTGFSMQQAYYLRWEMGFNMLNLPDSSQWCGNRPR